MKINTDQSGQSTIEFIVSFVFGVSLIFMVFNSALNYSTGYLVHYATFMASRVYLVADNGTGTISSPGISMSQGKEDATSTYDKYKLNIFKVGVDKFDINPLPEDGFETSEYLTVGAKTTFEMRLDAIGRVLGQTNLEFVSESFLGHEPSRAQCANRTCVGITGQADCNGDFDITLYDDGC